MSKHTPGPWYARTQKEHERLIAAAPELLEALIHQEKISSSPMCELSPDDFVKNKNLRRAAIAKATGEPQ